MDGRKWRLIRDYLKDSSCNSGGINLPFATDMTMTTANHLCTITVVFEDLGTGSGPSEMDSGQNLIRYTNGDDWHAFHLSSHTRKTSPQSTGASATYSRQLEVVAPSPGGTRARPTRRM